MMLGVHKFIDIHTVHIHGHGYLCRFTCSYQLIGIAIAFPQFDGVHIVSGSLDTSIRVWNADTGQCIHTLTGTLYTCF